MIEQEIIGDHIIYGDWSDVDDDQFMVYYHPNGIDCIVFIMSGQDYGGGIIYWFNSKSETIDKIVSKDSAYIKEEIENPKEAVLRRRELGFGGL